MISPLLSHQPTSIQKYEQLSKETGIPVEWLMPNVYRDETKKAWIYRCDGGEPQTKYDNPPKDENGKPKKYLSDKGSIADINIPLCPDGKSYAGKIAKRIDDGALGINDVQLLVTEGDKKAIVGCMHDLFTVSVHGVGKALTKGDTDLVPGLKSLVAGSDSKYECKNVCIVYDSDLAIKPQVAQEAIKLGLKLQDKYRCNVRIAMWEYMEDQKGMDDFINKNGIEAFRQVLEKAYTLDEYIDKFGDALKSKKLPSRKSGKKGHADIVAELSEYYGNRIRLNQMTNEVEKDGTEYYIDSSFIDISQEVGLELSKSYAIEYLIKVARQNAYHPVIEYLNSVKYKAVNLDTETALSELHKMLSQVTGIQDELHLTFVIKTLVAAVTRVFKPGCFFKRVCVFYGKQDAGKSSFWRELAGDKFFSSSYKGTADKDDLMALHSAWINEIAEFDKVYKKTDVANLKAVISDPFDRVRLPYDRRTSTLQRRSIMVASTNKQDILLDPTGHTRFWVVSIPGKIDFKSLLGCRDFIWACVYNLFSCGYSCELSEDEQLASAVNNEKYTSFDPLFDAVEDACKVVGWIKDFEEYVTIPEIYTHLYPELDGKGLKPSEWKPIGDALTRLGYTSGHKVRRHGKLIAAWKLEKVENSTVTAVTKAETQSQQGVPYCYHGVTDNQPTVTEKYELDAKVLPTKDHGNVTVTPTVTPTAQDFQLSVTAVTVKSQKSHEIKTEPWRVNVGVLVSYCNELVKVVGGDGKRWQVEYPPKSGQKNGRIENNVSTAHLKRPDLATVNNWGACSGDEKPAF